MKVDFSKVKQSTYFNLLKYSAKVCFLGAGQM